MYHHVLNCGDGGGGGGGGSGDDDDDDDFHICSLQDTSYFST
jgi:hypothetical protein